MFTKIARILPDAVHKNGIAPQVSRAAALEAFARAVEDLLPQIARGDFQPLHLRSETLTIACKSSSVALLLKQHEAELLRSVSETGVEPIARLRTILAPWR